MQLRLIKLENKVHSLVKFVKEFRKPNEIKTVKSYPKQKKQMLLLYGQVVTV